MYASSTHMKRKMDLEGRVLVLTNNKDIPRGKNLFMRRHPVRIEQAESLEGISAKAYDAIIITSRDLLEKNALKDNVEVPVIYHTRDNSDVPNAKAIEHNYNLFKVADRLTIDKALDNALDARATIKLYLSQIRNGIERLKRRGPPHFANALDLAREYQRAALEVEGMKRNLERAVAIQFQSIVAGMLAREIVPEEQKASVETTLRPLVDDFIKVHPYLTKEAILHLLGEGETGEEPVGSVNPPPIVKALLREPEVPQNLSNKRWLYRTVRKSKGLCAKDIAHQRYEDAKHFLNAKGAFRTRTILEPLDFEDYSFLLLSFVDGDPLYKVLERLNTAMERQPEYRKIKNLRQGLVESLLEASADWVNNSLELTIAKKPDEYALCESYVKGIKGLARAFCDYTTIKFTEEEISLWEESCKIMHDIQANPEHIVRYRDAWLGNTILGPKDNMSVEELIERYTKGKRADKGAITKNLTSIDLQYQFRHCLEDPCHILSAYETRFLLYEDLKKESIASLRRKKLSKFYKLKDDYLDRIGMTELKDDDLSFALMLAYRALRKSKLFIDYWKNTIESRENRTVTSFESELRRERFSRNINHYAILAGRACYELSRTQGNKASESARLALRKSKYPLSPKRAREYRRLLSESLPEDRGIILACTALSAMRKIENGFKQSRRLGRNILVDPNDSDAYRL
ncbi:hypothetical protein D6825_03705 [Candidatus Woesearchaeota archaeon]|nr:MAG: hypothetical protein D6825_03705 [Candidatus Woesearchaeota archaeon]